jgi:hypothetical protein
MWRYTPLGLRLCATCVIPHLPAGAFGTIPLLLSFLLYVERDLLSPFLKY